MPSGHVGLVAAASYEPEPAAVPAARHFVRETLRSWNVPGSDELLADAELLTSELVTNAVVHAETRVRVTCRAESDEVEVSVLDWQPGRAVARSPDREADANRAGGRGLLLPGALSSSWGVTYASAAKSVWFRLRPGGEDSALCLSPAATRGVRGRGGGGARFGQAGRWPLADGAASGAALLRLSYPELLSHTAERACDAVAAEAAYVLIADEDGVMSMRAAAGLSALRPKGRPAEQATAEPSGRAGMGLFLKVYEQLAEIGTDGVIVASGLQQSFLTAQVLADCRVTGEIIVMAAGPGWFTDEDSARLQHVADQVALPLERARLAEQDLAGRRRIGFLAEASEMLAGTLDQEQPGRGR